MKWILFVLLITLTNCTMTTETNQYVDDKKHGLWTEVSSENSIAVGNYQKGGKQGDWFFYKDSVCVKKVRYSNNQINGVAQAFFPNGKIRLQMNYEKDRVNGMVYFYSEDNVHLATYTYLYDKLAEVNYYFVHPDSPPKSKNFLPEL